jgi:hypothetical protein
VAAEGHGEPGIHGTPATMAVVTGRESPSLVVSAPCEREAPRGAPRLRCPRCSRSWGSRRPGRWVVGRLKPYLASTQKFARTNKDRLKEEFVDQICEATGGPCTHTGRSMTEAHHNMGVTSGEFGAFVEDVVAVLDDFKVGKPSRTSC